MAPISTPPSILTNSLKFIDSATKIDKRLCGLLNAVFQPIHAIESASRTNASSPFCCRSFCRVRDGTRLIQLECWHRHLDHADNASRSNRLNVRSQRILHRSPGFSEVRIVSRLTGVQQKVHLQSIRQRIQNTRHIHRLPGVRRCHERPTGGLRVRNIRGCPLNVDGRVQEWLGVCCDGNAWRVVCP